MGYADALRRALCRVHTWVNASEHRVYLRTVTETGGDVLLGLRGTQTVTDVEVLPKPFVTNVSFDEIQVSGGKLHAGDWAILFPPTGFTKAQVEASQVIVDGEVCDPHRVEEFCIEGIIVWMKVTASRQFNVGHTST